MLYALLGTLLLGGLSTLYLLWRKSQVEGDLRETQQKLVIANNAANSWEISYNLLKKTSDDKLARANQELATVKGQNDDLLKALEKSGNPGVFAELLQKRNTSSVSPTT